QLKPLNDAHGPMVGDLVISVVADAIATTSLYPAYRFGGDEFAITIPTADADQAADVADGVRRAVAAADRVPARLADRLFRYTRDSRLVGAGWFDHVLA